MVFWEYILEVPRMVYGRGRRKIKKRRERHYCMCEKSINEITVPVPGEFGRAPPNVKSRAGK